MNCFDLGDGECLSLEGDETQLESRSQLEDMILKNRDLCPYPAPDAIACFFDRERAEDIRVLCWRG